MSRYKMGLSMEEWAFLLGWKVFSRCLNGGFSYATKKNTLIFLIFSCTNVKDVNIIPYYESRNSRRLI